jgi:hypothetical protein
VGGAAVHIVELVSPGIIHAAIGRTSIISIILIIETLLVLLLRAGAGTVGGGAAAAAAAAARGAAQARAGLIPVYAGRRAVATTRASLFLRQPGGTKL